MRGCCLAAGRAKAADQFFFRSNILEKGLREGGADGRGARERVRKTETGTGTETEIERVSSSLFGQRDQSIERAPTNGRRDSRAPLERRHAQLGANKSCRPLANEEEPFRCSTMRNKLPATRTGATPSRAAISGRRLRLHHYLATCAPRSCGPLNNEYYYFPSERERPDRGPFIIIGGPARAGLRRASLDGRAGAPRAALMTGSRLMVDPQGRSVRPSARRVSLRSD